MQIRSQTTVYFIRHGQTPSNKAGIKQGVHIDDYLNQEGVMQVEQMAKLVKTLDLDVLFTSYLHRAEETAVLVQKAVDHPVQLLHDYRLRERDFGNLTGKTDQELLQVIPDWKHIDHLQQYDYRPFGGESVDDVRQRALSAVLDIIQNYNHKHVGIITHDGIIRLMLFHFPQIVRLYHQNEDDEDIMNTDIYEWVMEETVMDNLKSLLK